MTVMPSGCSGAASESLLFGYTAGAASGNRGLRTHEVAIEEVTGRVYVYATFDMGPANPIKYVDGVPQLQPARGEAGAVSAPAGGDAAGYYFRDLSTLAENPEQPQQLQMVALGQQTAEGFTVALKFGLADALRARYDEAYIAGWLFDGQLDYFGPYVRPNTPLDFKVRVDLQAQTMTAWASCRGDDKWVLLAENAPLMNAVTEINAVQVEQELGAAGVRNLMVRGRPWAPAERIQPSPVVKKNRVVGPGRGFKFQTMHSVWGQPGRHVAVSRIPEFHQAFTDVALAGPNHLVATWGNRSHSGGAGGESVAHSYDGGRTWGERIDSAGGGRIQRLEDGTLLLEGYYQSVDGGRTWTKLFSLDPVKVGGKGAMVPSRVAELADGSWLVVGSWYGGSPFDLTEARAGSSGQSCWSTHPTT